ncbi:intracellular protein transport protein USO1-like [Aphidius gifuensis]|uniref:intracellular protein transport protein USO1-like n=1 Tax=Aphidius gifuensis TaxID=684658 RepID=UPI001CDCB26F|nr:intracellular protein transport protein USO1-like [Aphidius gifuensis]
MNPTIITNSKIDATRSRAVTAYLDEDSITKSTEANFRLQIRQLNDENALLRDELVRIEESALLHERHAFKVQQKFDRIKRNFERLEKESDEHKELINNLETQEKRCREALRKVEKNHQTDIKKLQIDNKTLSSALEESNRAKFEYLNQLRQSRTNLTEETLKLKSLQYKVEELSQIKTNMEDYYRKKIQTLQDTIDCLKNENSSFLPVMSVQHSEVPTSTVIIKSSTVPLLEEDDCIIEYIQNSCKSKVQHSLYTELKSLGISPEKKDYKNKREWYSNEIEKAIQQIDRIAEILMLYRSREIVSEAEEIIDNECENEEKFLCGIFFQKITALSCILSKELSETNAGSQVSFSADLEKHQEIKIQSFNKLLSSHLLSRKSVMLLGSGLSRSISWYLTILYFAIAFILWLCIKYDNSFNFNLLYAGLSFKWWSFEEIIEHEIGIHKILPRPL